MATVHVVAICGSLRKQSFNRALIEASKQLAPQGMEIEFLDIGPIPPYNMDLESEFPSVVSELKDRIRAANGMLIACPEHNFSFSGVLKNAIDWFSRPPRENCLELKPAFFKALRRDGLAASKLNTNCIKFWDTSRCGTCVFPKLQSAIAEKNLMRT